MIAHRMTTALAALALAVAVAGAPTAVRGLPVPSPTPETPPPIDATATPVPAGTLVRFSGQLLDVRGGFVFFASGDGFRLAPGARIDDAASGGATALKPTPGVYARASFDKATGNVVELSLSRKPLPAEASYVDVAGFAIAASTPVANPDLGKPGEGSFSGKRVLVTFVVQVPPSTPLGDDVYLSTDQSGWNPQAYKLDRIDGLHYRITQFFNSGTKLLYRFTRGSAQTAERGEDGLEPKPHVFVVTDADVRVVPNVVYHWADDGQSAPENSLPTPFNPHPFSTPPRPH
jgi:hypothetical protein